MSGKVVVGIRERKHFASGLASHLNGATRPKGALDKERCLELRGRDPVTALLPDGSADVEAVLAAHRAKRRRGGQANEVIELMLAGPPPWEQERDEDGNLVGEPPWPEEKVNAWIDASLAWGLKIFGPESKLLGGWLHADEKSPHLHLAGVPILKGRISWKALKQRFTSEFLGRSVVHHRLIYSAMRDSYHEEVGKRFGLARGEVKVFDEKGQDAKPIDRAKADEHRERVAKAQANEAEAELAKLQKDVVSATRRGRKVREQRERAESAEAERDELRVKLGQTEAERDGFRKDSETAIEERDAARTDSAALREEGGKLRRQLGELQAKVDGHAKELTKARNSGYKSGWHAGVDYVRTMLADYAQAVSGGRNWIQEFYHWRDVKEGKVADTATARSTVPER